MIKIAVIQTHKWIQKSLGNFNSKLKIVLSSVKLEKPKPMRDREEKMADGPYRKMCTRLGLFHLGQNARWCSRDRVGLMVALSARGVRPSDRGAGVAAGALAGPPSRLTRTRTHSVSDDRVHVRGSAVVRAGPLLGVPGGARLRQTRKEPLSFNQSITHTIKKT